MFEIKNNKVYESDEDVRDEYVGKLDNRKCPICGNPTFKEYWDSGQGEGTSRRCTKCSFINEIWEY